MPLTHVLLAVAILLVTVTMRLSLFLLNEHDDDDDARYGHSYYRTLIGNRRRSIERSPVSFPMTLSDVWRSFGDPLSNFLVPLNIFGMDEAMHLKFHRHIVFIARQHPAADTRYWCSNFVRPSVRDTLYYSIVWKRLNISVTLKRRNLVRRHWVGGRELVRLVWCAQNDNSWSVNNVPVSYTHLTLPTIYSV